MQEPRTEKETSHETRGGPISTESGALWDMQYSFANRIAADRGYGFCESLIYGAGIQRYPTFSLRSRPIPGKYI